MTEKMESVDYHEQVTIAIDKYVARVARGSSANLAPCTLMAFQRFNEYRARLKQRYWDLRALEMKLYAASSETGRRIKDIQFDFVDKMESFYQGVYSTISAFMMLLSYITPRSFRQGMSIRSAKCFLEFLEAKFDDLAPDIAFLKMARDFRVRFVDHIQQHVLHDWMTYSYPGESAPESVVIYFIRRGNDVYAPSPRPVDPYSPEFRPPISHESFYVSPPHKEVYRALMTVAAKTIEYVSQPGLGR